MGKIRGLLTKLPGFTFSSYKEIAFFSITLIPDYQYYDMIQAVIGSTESMQVAYAALVDGYNFTNNIPKEYMFVALNPNIT